jgi:AraC family transcriptional regulator
MVLHVKNMVCDRCVLSVKNQLESLDFVVKDITLGKVDVYPDPTKERLQDISSSLSLLGFELLDREKDQLVERIKNQVIEIVHYSNLNEITQSLTSIIAGRLKKDYAYLSRLFSDSEGLTIEKYIIHQKIEKVKELIEYGELNLNEISYEMGYSSSAHLSTQFKSITGITPSQYKSSDRKLRKPLDQIE